MRKALSSSKGFALAETLIVLVILVVVGGAGYYVYHRSHTAKKTPSNGANQNQASKNDTATSPVAHWSAKRL